MILTDFSRESMSNMTKSKNSQKDAIILCKNSNLNFGYKNKYKTVMNGLDV